MFICIDCGKTYEDYEVETTECECGGELVEAYRCKKCYNWTPIHRPICMDCLNEYKTVETMLEIGSDWEEQISLNGFLVSAFTKEDIERILTDALKSKKVDEIKKEVDKYCDDDIVYFMEVAERKCKEES